MKRRFRKLMAVLLASAMIVQPGSVTAFAEESVHMTEEEVLPETKAARKNKEAPAEKPAEASTEAPAENPAEAPPEKQTEAPTEKQTEAPTEKQTEAPTEKPTEASPEKPTEKQTEAPTEKQTEAPTEKPTEVPTEPVTEKPTETQTEIPEEKSTEGASTETPDTEAETEEREYAEEPSKKPDDKTAETEKTQTEKSETESPTEVQTEVPTDEPETESGRIKKDGQKLKASDLKEKLTAALPYLFVTERYTGEELPEEDLLGGGQAEQVLGALEKEARSFAEVRGSSEIQVIDLYADEDGVIDTAPLGKLFGGEKIDVSSKYALVNVIADSADQDLSFSGYSVFYQNVPVTYENPERVGYVLYNFTAYEAGEIKDYEGTVTLSGSQELQGTYLAPAGEVKLMSDLSGAVYAEAVEVSGAPELQKIVLIEGRESQRVDEAGTEPEESQSETESMAETGEPQSEGETGTEPEESQSETEAMTEDGEPQSETEAGTEAGEAMTEDEIPEADGVEQQTETDASDTSAADNTPETPVTAEIDWEAPDFAEASMAMMVLEEDVIETVESSVWYSAKGVGLKVRMTDSRTEARAAGGAVEVRAAEDVLAEDGTVVLAQDETAAAHSWENDSTEDFDIGKSLHYGGEYYLETVQAPEGYLAGARIYFSIDEQGQPVFAPDAAWNAQQKLLFCPVFRDPAFVQTGETAALITLNGGDKTLSGARFVVKDQSGQAILDETGRPKYLVSLAQGRAAVRGLPSGSYILTQLTAPEGYQVSGDLPFTVTDGQSSTVAVTNERMPEQGHTLEITMETRYGDTLLTAEKKSVSYVALFGDKKLTKKATEVRMLAQKKGTESAEAVVFEGLTEGAVYYLAETDAFGTPMRSGEGQPELPYESTFLETAGEKEKKISHVVWETERVNENAASTDSVKAGADVIEDDAADQTKRIKMRRAYTAYPAELFSYLTEVTFTKKVLDHKKKAKAVSDAFYVTLFEDEERTNRIGDPIEILLENTDTANTSAEMKMTAGEAVYYAAETDQDGRVLETGNGTYEFAVGMTDTLTGQSDGTLTVRCGAQAGLTVTNTMSKAVVRMSVVDESGEFLPDAELVLKNENGRVVSVNKTVVFKSEGEALVWNGVLPEGTYYLSEVNAPAGYLPAVDQMFTVESGTTAEVVLQNAKASGGSSMTAGIQIYEGQHLLYAQDTTAGTFAAEGAYTRYAALFEDEACTRKVSNVQAITMTGFLGTTTFEHLKKGQTYYLSETDAYGQARKSDANRSIRYTKGGKFTAGASGEQMVISEIYAALPNGYRYTARLTLQKRVMDAEGNPKPVTGSFYIGIFRTADYSDAPTLIRLDLNNQSSASVSKRILLSGTSDVTYYFAEVDENGRRVADSAEFNYVPSVDRGQITLTKSADETVTVTNRDKVSKVTLYLTKRVFEGAEPAAVNQIFYAGLFKDKEFTQLYANPIPMTLTDSDAITLKLSLNLGNASEVTVYVAEVDENGRVVRSGSDFGYDVKVVNSTAKFTQEKTEIQSVLVNSVYGTSSADDWQSILNDEEINSDGWYGGGGYDDGYWGNVSDNGEASYDGTESVQTGDATPWLTYLTLLLASGLVLFTGSRRRRKRSADGKMR